MAEILFLLRTKGPNRLEYDNNSSTKLSSSNIHS